MPAERSRWSLVLALALPAVAAAPPPDGDAVPRAAPPLSAADVELLEFLGEFDDAKGEFVDPFVIEEVGAEVAAASREAARKKEQAAAAPPPERKP